MFIDEAHMALGIFPVFFPSMLPTLSAGLGVILQVCVAKFFDMVMVGSAGDDV